MVYVEYAFIVFGLLLALWNLGDAIIDFRWTARAQNLTSANLDKADITLVALGWVVREVAHIAILLTLLSFLINHGLRDTSSLCVASIVCLKSAWNRLIRVKILMTWNTMEDLKTAQQRRRHDDPPPETPA